MGAAGSIQTIEVSFINDKTGKMLLDKEIKKVIENLQKARTAKTEKAKGELFNGENDTPQYPLGFQSYKLAKSNFKQWNKYVVGEEAILEQLNMFQQAEIEGSLPENMLYELILKSGFDLTTSVEKVSVGDTSHAYNVANNQLWVYFDAYTQEVKKHILSANPERLICLDSCFGGDDVAITNLQLELRENGIDLTII
jgi:adenine-specific DNA-methyltransferase